MEKLIRDNYANYVIQTALEYATPVKKATLVDTIRPVLPSVRSTPYGRRIQAKIHNYDGRTSGHVTPADPTGGQIPLRASHNRGLSNGVGIPPVGNMGFAGLPNGMPGNMGGPGNMGNAPPTMSPQRSNQGGFPAGTWLLLEALRATCSLASSTTRRALPALTAVRLPRRAASRSGCNNTL